MKSKHIFKISLVFLTMLAVTSCEKNLDYKSFDQFSESTFFTNAADAKAATTYIYTGLTGGRNAWSAGYGSQKGSWTVESDIISGQMIVDWGCETCPTDQWGVFMQMSYDVNNTSGGDIYYHYNQIMPILSSATVYIDKINGIDMDATLKKRYIAEIKALRAHLSYVLYKIYGPVPVRLDPVEAANPNAKPIPRPTRAQMVANIIKDYNEAMADLPNSYTGADVGRMTKGACLMGLLKLYMQEKMWDEAITAGRALKTLGDAGVYGLVPNYKDIFTYENQGNKELIVAIPTNQTNWELTNRWLAHALPASPEFIPATGPNISQWGGYKIPWRNYDKFDPADKRLSVLYRKYPVDRNGTLWDAKTGGMIGTRNYGPLTGAIPMKYGADPTASGEQQAVNIVVWRYADALLLLAEALNEKNGGPTTEAYDLVGLVRTRAGLANWPSGLSQADFRTKMMDERFFELWAEGVSREDLIRWGTLLTTFRKPVTGYTINPRAILFPIPTKVVGETNNVVQQNPGY